MTINTARHEEITGSDLTGSDGHSNRTYTLANSDALLPQMIVIRGEAVLQSGVGFSLDTDTDTITFLTEVWNNQPITIDYFTSPTSTEYATTLQVTRFGGIGVDVELETLTLATGSDDSYDTKNGNIIASSYEIYYGNTGSNDLNIMTENIDYTIDKDGGGILLTSTGKNKVSGKLLYISYTYSPKQSDTVLATYLGPASREVEKITGNYWGSVTSSVQYFDGYDSGYPQTDEPFGTQIEPYPELELKNKGVATITSVLFLDKQGDTDTTLDSDDYRIITDDDGQDSRLLVNKTIPNGKANVQVTYTHGYSSVPELVQELTALVAGKMALVNISGGSYKDISTYSLGRQSFSIGQIYINIENSIKRVQERIDAIMLDLGSNFTAV